MRYFLQTCAAAAAAARTAQARMLRLQLTCVRAHCKAKITQSEYHSVSPIRGARNCPMLNRRDNLLGVHKSGRYYVVLSIRTLMMTSDGAPSSCGLKASYDLEDAFQTSASHQQATEACAEECNYPDIQKTTKRKRAVAWRGKAQNTVKCDIWIGYDTHPQIANRMWQVNELA
eukprot:1575421-Amphidinium_carterae.1